MFKTLSALTYISNEDYRRRIHHTLNKGELLHALPNISWVFSMYDG